MNQSLTISFVDQAAASEAESFWIRLEQVELPDEAATLEQAAELVDALYGVDPCEDGLGGGGEEADEEALPEEEEFLDMARDTLDLSMCDESASATWETEVDVLRSHQDGYSLEGERIEVGETTIMSRTRTETLDVDGARIDLAWPCAGEVVVSGGAAVREVRGSTVVLAAPVKGRVRISYRSVWDRVRLRVRRAAAAGQGGGPLVGFAFVGGSSPKKDSREEDAASVVAFWRNLAAECALTRPPADDQDIDRAELERLCNRRSSWDKDEEGECWRRIVPYNRCNCSGDEAPDPPEPREETSPCPEGVEPGTFLGEEREFGEYVDCEGEDDEGLNTPEFFKEHCCEEEPYADLPRCRETREDYRGGEEIENGPQHWRDLYGENVRLTAVTPEGGRCGELIKVWAVPDEIPPPPELPENLAVDAGERFSVTVSRGGRLPFDWQPPAGVEFLGEAAYGFMGLFRAADDFIGGVLTVTDACGRSAAVTLTAAALYWVPIYNPENPASWWYDPPDQPYRRVPMQPTQTRPLGRCFCSVRFEGRPECDRSVGDEMGTTKCLHTRYAEYDTLYEAPTFVSASGKYLARIDNYFGPRTSKTVSGTGYEVISYGFGGPRCRYTWHNVSDENWEKYGKCIVRREDWEPRAQMEIAENRIRMREMSRYTFLDGYLVDDGFIIKYRYTYYTSTYDFADLEVVCRNYAKQVAWALYALSPCG